MASPEHLKLANFIKSTHEYLRKQSKLLGPEKAWIEHCSKEETLSNYASAMQELATQYWEENSRSEKSKAVSRIKWTSQEIRNYFTDELLCHREKERQIAKKINVELCETVINSCPGKIKVLDVGSCYNPLNTCDDFEVTAIDIAPANNTVYKCDFLNVNVCDRILIDNGVVHSLKSSSFYVVLFSLILEYLPCPHQRLLCCKKAYDLLIPEGVLIVITPDSKNSNCNMDIVKSWRYLFAEMGFRRIKQEKLPYINCMIFRKSLNSEIARRWAKLNERYKVYDLLVIPQDFNKQIVEEFERHLDNFNSCDNVELFSELPYNEMYS